MKDKITFLTKEQNLYFSEKLKLDVLIFGIVSMGNTVLPAVIVLFQWEEVIEKLSTLSLWGGSSFCTTFYRIPVCCSFILSMYSNL